MSFTKFHEIYEVFIEEKEEKNRTEMCLVFISILLVVRCIFHFCTISASTETN